MSVYTTLTLQEVQDFAAPYGLNVIDLIPIQGGIQNTNYFLTCQEGQQCVLTLFEELDHQAAGELVPVLVHLAQHGVAVPVPLHVNGEAILTLKDKPAQIAPRLQGQHPQPANLAQVIEIATAQAKMHVALQQFPLQRSNVRDHQYWMQVGRELQPNLNAADQTLLSELFGLFDKLTTAYPNRPRGLIHADLFRDNTLFAGDQLVGILDFYEMNHDDLLFDIAITLNDFCTDEDFGLNPEKMAAFLTAYAAIRPLTDDERACLEIYLAMAAGRFWLMRLRVAAKNTQLGLNSDDILHKNPNEMRHMLMNRLKFVTA